MARDMSRRQRDKRRERRHLALTRGNKVLLRGQYKNVTSSLRAAHTLKTSQVPSFFSFSIQMLHAFLDSLVRVYVRRTVRLKYYPQHPVPKLPQIITLLVFCVTDQI